MKSEPKRVGNHRKKRIIFNREPKDAESHLKLKRLHHFGMVN